MLWSFDSCTHTSSGTTNCSKLFKQSSFCTVNTDYVAKGNWKLKFTAKFIEWKPQQVQGDQKVSVHLMITIQKVTSTVQSVPGPVSKHLLTRRTVFSKTVFSIARFTFRMYFVMAILKSSLVWGLFEYRVFHRTPEKKLGGERSGDLGDQMVSEMILSANTSSKSVKDIRAVCAVAPSCWK